MAREVQIITWCDRCLSEGLQVNATEFAGVNTAGMRVLVDLCDDCLIKYMSPALAVLDTFGRAEAKAPHATRRSGPAPGPCPECHKEFASSQSLGMHRWRKHGIPSEHRKPKKSAA